ncbi:hypothetical protein [Polluticaenibacter yanchengensis]|uniref:Uncharacterized protein n=1 Tax=Polluticaenibacter yanchengensis TaxID=3014562 RepID=A0ABT4UEJ6_9BACT|nr:hypothetical protein [Chitinophagaceae bacterium LY-5]
MVDSPVHRVTAVQGSDTTMLNSITNDGSIKKNWQRKRIAQKKRIKMMRFNNIPGLI